jgi:hypothetical protein
VTIPLRFVWVNEFGSPIATLRSDGVIWINEDADHPAMCRLLGTLMNAIPAPPVFTTWTDVHAVRRMLCRCMKIVFIAERRKQ